MVEIEHYYYFFPQRTWKSQGTWSYLAFLPEILLCATVWEQSVSFIPAGVSQEHSPPMSSESFCSSMMLFQTGQKATCFLFPNRLSVTNPDILVKQWTGKEGDVITRPWVTSSLSFLSVTSSTFNQIRIRTEFLKLSRPSCLKFVLGVMIMNIMS